MTTLRIEHAIHDYDLWKSAFDRFADKRAKAGVRGVTIRMPVDDPKYLMLDLEFDTADRARDFETFLRQHIWSSRTSSPALAGAPQTRILDLVLSSAGQLTPVTQRPPADSPLLHGSKQPARS